MTKINFQVSTDDLLRLLGDDPDTQLEIRSSIVQQFTDRYLKSLVNHETVKETERILREGIKDEIQKVVGSASWQEVHLKPRIKSQVKDLVESHVGTTLRTLVTEAVAEQTERISKQVSDVVARQYNVDIRRQVEARVQEIVAKMSEVSA